MRTLSLFLTCFLFLFFAPLSGQTMIGWRVLSGASGLTSPEGGLPVEFGWHDKVAGTIFGLVVETKITYHLSLRSGLQQTQRGISLRNGRVPSLLGAYVPHDFDAQVRMNYLEVPLALKYSLPLADQQIVLYSWGGVTAGYALAGSVRARAAKDPISPLATTRLAMNNYLFSRFHLGGSVGFGAGINLGKCLQFRLEAAYNRSIEEKSMLSSESGKHGYETLHVGAGVSFRW